MMEFKPEFNPAFLKQQKNSRSKRKAKMLISRTLLNLDLLGLNNEDIVDIVVATVREIYGKDLKPTNYCRKKLKKPRCGSYKKDYILDLIKKKEE